MGFLLTLSLSGTVSVFLFPACLGSGPPGLCHAAGISALRLSKGNQTLSLFFLSLAALEQAFSSSKGTQGQIP